MRRLRFFEDGSVVEVTARTIQSRLLMKPSTVVNDLIVGVLGRAQARYGMEILYAVFLSNHYHLLCRPRDARHLARFMNFVNSNLARELGRVYGWRARFWSRRYQAIPVSREPAALEARLLYLMAHGCKEGFVASPEEWPGVQTLTALLTGRPLQGTWFDRSRECEARRQGREFGVRDFASTEELHLTPLPCWSEMGADDRVLKLRQLVALVEREVLSRQGETGRRPKGARWVERQDPRSRPVRTKRSPAPLIHAASRSVRETFRASYRAFVAAYREAASLLLAGARTVEFPRGCFLPAPPGRWSSP